MLFIIYDVIGLQPCRVSQSPGVGQSPDCSSFELVTCSAPGRRERRVGECLDRSAAFGQGFDLFDRLNAGDLRTEEGHPQHLGQVSIDRISVFRRDDHPGRPIGDRALRQLTLGRDFGSRRRTRQSGDIEQAT